MERLSTDLMLRSEQLFNQTVNVVVYEELHKQYFTAEASEIESYQSEEVLLSKDELNSLRYACGYVALKLLKRYENKKHLGKKGEEFETCLKNMAVAGEETNFTVYTTEWN